MGDRRRPRRRRRHGRVAGSTAIGPGDWQTRIASEIGVKSARKWLELFTTSICSRSGMMPRLENISRSAICASAEVSAIYFGLGTAYFVDVSGQYAGTLTPAPEGWVAKVRPELATRISRLIAQYQRQEPATLVNLPVSLP